MGKLHHYFTRSQAHWDAKIRRGYHDTDRKASEFELYDRNEVFDDSAARYAPMVREELAKKVASNILLQDKTCNKKLIFDIGMSEGNDSNLYLLKGFTVVGVEADVEVYKNLCKRFESERQSGRITIYNFAASDSCGKPVNFFHHENFQGLSGLYNHRPEFSEGSFVNYQVLTINWPTLIQTHGIPYYLKIDIEGNEVPFLKSLLGHTVLPEYISVECHTMEPVEYLFNLGYRLFRLIDQNPPDGFQLPNPQIEGSHIDSFTWWHSSGPFGRELPEGEWLDFDRFKEAWNASKAEFHRTWFDCHAWMPR